MLVTGAITNNKDGVFIFGFSQKDKESTYATGMRETGRMGYVMALECSTMPMDQNIKGIGRTT